MPSEVCGPSVKAQRLRTHEKGTNMFISTLTGAFIIPILKKVRFNMEKEKEKKAPESEEEDKSHFTLRL